MTTFATSWLQFLGVTVPLLLTSSLAPADSFDSARTRIQNVMIAHDIPSVTIAVAHKQKIVWEQGFGWADVERRIPATPHTSYALASIGKSMTATALMMLVERGKIDLDQPMDRYLGEHELVARIGNARDATVRRVASHTAGLSLHGLFVYEDEPGAPPTLEETFRRYGVIAQPPGEAFVYSNLGFGLLEAAIERASGKSYTEFLTEELFIPLGLNDASVFPDIKPGSAVATRYWGQRVVARQDSDIKGAGAVYMSAHDLVRYGMFHLHGRIEGQRGTILQPRSLQAMREATLLNDGSSSGYGVGWFVGEKHGLRYFGHNGGNAGTATVLAIYPEHEVVIVVLGNGVSRTGAVHFLEDDVIHALLPETIRNDHGFKPDPQFVGRWHGQIQTYQGPIAAHLEFKDNGSVFARVGPGAWQEVIKVKLDSKTQLLKLENLLGTLDTPDATRHSGPLQLTLKLRGQDTLNGVISSNALETMRDRMGSAVSYWIDLRKERPLGNSGR